MTRNQGQKVISGHLIQGTNIVGQSHSLGFILMVDFKAFEWVACKDCYALFFGVGYSTILNSCFEYYRSPAPPHATIRKPA